MLNSESTERVNLAQVNLMKARDVLCRSMDLNFQVREEAILDGLLHAGNDN